MVIVTYCLFSDVSLIEPIYTKQKKTCFTLNVSLTNQQFIFIFLWENMHLLSHINLEMFFTRGLPNFVPPGYHFKVNLSNLDHLPIINKFKYFNAFINILYFIITLSKLIHNCLDHSLETLSKFTCDTEEN